MVYRGFRDSVKVMEGLGLEVVIPPFLDARRKFSTTESNQSKCITKVTWIVEAINGRIKQFRFFSNTIQNSSLPRLEAYISIGCSIINRYRSPMINSGDGHFAPSHSELPTCVQVSGNEFLSQKILDGSS